MKSNDTIRCLQQNMRAKAAAEELVAMAPAVLDGVKAERFWQMVAKFAAEKCGLVLAEDAPSQIAVMTEEEAMRFREEEVPGNGEYAGQQVQDVPKKYLSAWADNPFHRRLRRYTRSAYFQRLS